MSNESDIQDAILSFLDAALPEKVVEQAIPDSQLVPREPVSGQIQPMVALQFGDLQQGQAYSFAGARGDDYILPVYTQALAGDPRIARRLSNRVRNALLGMSFPWTGDIRKRPGGGMFPLVSSNGATEAYVYPASFGILIQFE